VVRDDLGDPELLVGTTNGDGGGHLIGGVGLAVDVDEAAVLDGVGNFVVGDDRDNELVRDQALELDCLLEGDRVGNLAEAGLIVH
jgi:hypothetical protein